MNTETNFRQTRVEILKGIARGELALREGRVLSHEEVVKRLKRRLKGASAK